MRVRLILENGGHTLSKVVEFPRVPAIGSTVRVDRERRVVLLKTDARRSEVDVYLREDADDLLMQITPEAHLAFVELMKRDGWAVEDEEALRAWLTHRVNRQGRVRPVGQNSPGEVARKAPRRRRSVSWRTPKPDASGI